MIHHVEVQVLLLLLVAAFVGMGARRMRLPYTLALVVTGLGLGAMDLSVLHGVELNADLLLLLLLPALLFEAAFHINFKAFRKDLVPIVALAVPGVLIACAVSTGVVYLVLSQSGLVSGFGLREALLVSAVLAATDPVSVLALFREFGVAKRLYLLIEGESLLNDGVAVVIFAIVMTVFGLGESSHALPEGRSLIAFSLETFARMAGGGVLIGVVLGAGFSVLTRQVEDHLIETVLTALLAYGSFLLAEQVHCSGVLATVCAGIMAGSVGAKRGMSASTKRAVVDFWELAAFLANSFVFLLVGLELEPRALAGFAVAIVATFVATVVARLAAVYLTLPILGWFSNPVPPRWRPVMAWGGLRGSLSMVLILTLPTSLESRPTLVAIVFGVVGLSLFIQGLSMGPVLRALGVVEPADRDTSYDLHRTQVVVADHAIEEIKRFGEVELMDDSHIERVVRHYDEARTRSRGEAKAIRAPGAVSATLVRGLRSSLHAEAVGLRMARDKELLSEEEGARLEAELSARLVAFESAAKSKSDASELFAAALVPLVAAKPPKPQ